MSHLNETEVAMLSANLDGLAANGHALTDELLTLATRAAVALAAGETAATDDSIQAIWQLIK